jgi:O-antigen/teichoic acid export membrane protein
VTAGIARQEGSRSPRGPGGRHRLDESQRQPAPGRIRTFVGESLVRNAAFLGTNVVIGTVTGLGTLTLLTRLYPVQAIGLSAAALSATGLITSISQLGLNYSLVRFLPKTPRRADMINSALTATLLVALVSGVVFLALPSTVKLYALGGLTFVALFLFSTGMVTGSAQLQNVFVADRSAGKIVRANIFNSVARLATPAAFLFAGVAGAYIAQGVVPPAVEFIVLAVMLARRGHRFRPLLSVSATRELRRFSAGTYIASLIGGLPIIVLPLIILSRFGPSQSAYWYAAIAGASVLFSLPGSVSQALLAEAAHQPGERRALIRRSATLIVAVMMPVLATAYLAAPFGLALLGHHYEAQALATLRLLIIAAAMSSVNYITGTILYLAKKAFAIAAINTVDAIVVLGLAVTWANNTEDVARAWVVGEVVNVALFLVFAAFALHQVHGRWEALGGDQVEREAPSAARRYVSRDSQQAGLDVLFSLATHGMTGPIYAPGQPPPAWAQPRDRQPGRPRTKFEHRSGPQPRPMPDARAGRRPRPKPDPSARADPRAGRTPRPRRDPPAQDGPQPGRTPRSGSRPPSQADPGTGRPPRPRRDPPPGADPRDRHR